MTPGEWEATRRAARSGKWAPTSARMPAGFILKAPLPIQGPKREWPSPVAFLEKAAGAHVDLENPFWWDAPVWRAPGRSGGC